MNLTAHLHTIPAHRMDKLTKAARNDIAAMLKQGAVKQRKARDESKQFPGWTSDDSPAAYEMNDAQPAGGEGYGGLAVVAVVLLGVAATVCIALWIF